MNNIIGLLAQPIGLLLAWIYGIVQNYGLSIVILTFLVRLLMLPMYSKQIQFQAKTAELQPKIAEIQERYAGNREMISTKTMELYKKEGVSQSSGCLPLLVQMPIIMGLFALLRNPLEYMAAPEMIAAVHESFLWINDLCQPDSWILPIIAGLSTYLSSSVGGTASAGGMGKGMMYFFPLMIFLMGRSFPAGIALYWAIGNLFSIGQTLLFKRRTEEDKLRAEIIADVKEARKKSKEKRRAQRSN